MSGPREWDRTMIARVAVGDDDALGEILRRYGGAVHASAARLVGDDQANDITQDVFVALWQHPERYDPSLGDLCSYLVVCARRRGCDLLRSRGRRAARERRASAVMPSMPSSVETDALAAVVGGRVRRALEHLPASQRRAVELAYLGGLTYRDVASVMGVAEGTAKSRLRLGLARLARELAVERDRTTEQPLWS